MVRAGSLVSSALSNPISRWPIWFTHWRKSSPSSNQCPIARPSGGWRLLAPAYLALALAVWPRATCFSTMVRALRAPVSPVQLDHAPCQDVIIEDVNLDGLPILTHFAEDGGPYVTSAVAVVMNPRLGRNLSFHRLMRVGPRTFTARLVEGRGLHTAWREAGGNLSVAMCVGAPLAVQLAASMSPAPGVDELAIANALRPTPTVQAVGLDLQVPLRPRSSWRVTSPKTWDPRDPLWISHAPAILCGSSLTLLCSASRIAVTPSTRPSCPEAMSTSCSWACPVSQPSTMP